MNQKPKRLRIFYRGDLDSCNYDCSYCPFAKRQESQTQRQQDTKTLERFIQWVVSQHRPLEIMFTPWGEALTRQRYRMAVVTLLAHPAVHRLVFQTNLSGSLHFLKDVLKPHQEKLILWCTYHPDQTTLSQFLDKSKQLQAIGIQHSVGMVAKPDFFNAIADMRQALAPDQTLWLNAWRDAGCIYRYTETQLAWLRTVDPHFDLSHKPHRSRGKLCTTGTESFLIEGNGTMKRCHFVSQSLGNVYNMDWEKQLASHPTPCPKTYCDCHIGYIHLPHLPIQQAFGDEALGRLSLKRHECLDV